MWFAESAGCMNIDYTRYYLKWHQNTPEHRASMVAMYQRILGPYLPQNRQARMLDVGCGMGFALSTLQSLGFQHLEGFDCDTGQVQACVQAGLNVTQVPVEETLAHLRARAGVFDFVLSLDVLEHIPVNAVMEVVAAIAGTLRPGGVFLCTVPNANNLIAERWRYNDWTHHNSFTEHSLDFLLYNGGFQDIQIHPIEFQTKPPRAWLPVGAAKHWWLFRFFRLWRRLEMMAELGPAQGRAVPLSLNLLAVARDPKPR